MIRPREGPLIVSQLPRFFGEAQDRVSAAAPLLLDGAAALSVIHLNDNYMPRGIALNIVTVRRTDPAPDAAAGRAMAIDALIANYRDRQYPDDVPKPIVLSIGQRPPELGALPVAATIDNFRPSTGFDASAARADAAELANDEARAEYVQVHGRLPGTLAANPQYAVIRDRVGRRHMIDAVRAEYAAYAAPDTLTPAGPLRARAAQVRAEYGDRVPPATYAAGVRAALINAAAAVYVRAEAAILAAVSGRAERARAAKSLIERQDFLSFVQTRLGQYVGECVGLMDVQRGIAHELDLFPAHYAVLARFPENLANIGAAAVALGRALCQAELQYVNLPTVVAIGGPAAQAAAYHNLMVELALGSGIATAAPMRVSATGPGPLPAPVNAIINAWPALFRGSVLPPPDVRSPPLPDAYYRLALTLAQTDVQFAPEQTVGLPVGRDTLFVLCALPAAPAVYAQLRVHVVGNDVYVWVAATGRVFLFYNLLATLAKTDTAAHDLLLEFNRTYNAYAAPPLDVEGMLADKVWRAARFLQYQSTVRTRRVCVFSLICVFFERRAHSLPLPLPRHNSHSAFFFVFFHPAQRWHDSQKLSRYIDALSGQLERRLSQAAEVARGREAQLQEVARLAEAARKAAERCDVCKARPATWQSASTGQKFCDVCRAKRSVGWGAPATREYEKGSALPAAAAYSSATAAAASPSILKQRK